MARIRANTQKLLQFIIAADQDANDRIYEVGKSKMERLEEKLRLKAREDKVKRAEFSQKILAKLAQSFTQRNQKTLEDLDFESETLEQRLDLVVSKALKKRKERLDRRAEEASRIEEHYIQVTLRYWIESMEIYHHRRKTLDDANRLKAEQRLEYEDSVFYHVTQAKIEHMLVEEWEQFLEEEVAAHIEKQGAILASFLEADYEFNEEEIMRLDEVTFEAQSEDLIFG